MALHDNQPHLRASWEGAHLGSHSARLRGVPQVPLHLQSQPDLRVPSRQFLKEQSCFRTDGTAAIDNGVEAPAREDTVAFRKTGVSKKFRGPLSVRNSFREGYPAAFERMARAFSIG
jgi:hypothetical protein